ncbi:MAG: riboflavin biosynthesis protein RibF, partial [Candidatus Cloacimonetes bacterium]|nr:riboflavin biosynthesis protein RibF [Candidatus Cloacimonadota bacterium]
KKTSIVLTYKKHPREVIRKELSPYILAEDIKRTRILKKLGVDQIAYIPFDEKFALISAEEFIESYLIKNFNPAAIIIGYDTHFGHNKKGNIDLLEEYAKKFNFELIQTEPLTMQNNKIISSSLIRDFVKNGLMENAQHYLGYYYSIMGNVVSGKQLGRKMGFPTINIKPIEKYKLIPANGVYVAACKVYKKSDKFLPESQDFYICAANIGTSPSVKTSGLITIEGHLINYTGDLYHNDVELYFLHKIRDEIKFDNKEQLIKQIDTDVKYTVDFFDKFQDWAKLW